ncbi:DUF3429 domain-containing protein [Sphingomonas glaciei]|uniref:DUF3429 domain-containing protein n=1 Tax=Sphingomonas glaciei TaxID=2938948 RepID=A0ABY5MY84_9SPHN|nr:DUF3429 domain-containing protein [Sphingomonas glaciei]UUR08058.1 DUF3429 domain-containing protein [Sphingomonas glaciei]
MKTTIPLPALLLGFAGLIPPVGLTAVALLDLGLFAPSTPGFVLTYAAIILSFLGGTWWGFVSRQERPGWVLLGISVLPALAGWAAIFSFQPPAALFTLAGALVASLVMDALLVRRRLAPRWWMKLRVPLSLLLTLCCCLSGWVLVR